MNTEPIEYFYSVRSSFTYLGAARLNELSERVGIPIRHYPIELDKVIQTYNDLHDPRPADRAFAGARAYERFPAREHYTQIEYRRWSEYRGIPIEPDPVHHYGPRLLPSGVVIAGQDMGLNVDRLSHDILQGLWRDDRDIADERVIRDVIHGCGLQTDPEALVQRAKTEKTELRLQRNTELAVERGVFGSPFYLYRNEPFFGQDRLFFLEAAIVRVQADATDA